MTKQEFLDYCTETYGTIPDYPFESDPVTTALRHSDNKKWYGIVMRLSRRKFGFDSDEMIDVVNMKLPVELMGFFGESVGVHPAFHMNKLHWISVLLPDAPDDIVHFLINASFEATKIKKRRVRSMFETEHLIIRKFRPGDAQRLYENHLEEEVKKWIPGESYADIEETRDAISFYAGCVDKKELPYVLAVELKETGELIGDTGINEVDGVPDEVEIGYTICKKHSGKGYATELLRAMSEFAASTFGIHVLYGRVMHGNSASVRVLEKNGYTFVREEFGAEDDPYGNGMLIYKLES